LCKNRLDWGVPTEDFPLHLQRQGGLLPDVRSPTGPAALKQANDLLKSTANRNSN